VRPVHATELGAAAAAALQQLDQYLNVLEELLRSPGESRLHQLNSDAFEAMRGLTASLPQVRACWVEVLISRFELLDATGRSEARAEAAGHIARLHQKHIETLEHFRRLCWGYISRDPMPAPQADRRPFQVAPEALLEGARRRALEGEQRVTKQRELIERIEAGAGDASEARRVLRTMEHALEVMHFNLSVARRQSG
jgi:hypothetical protein